MTTITSRVPVEPSENVSKRVVTVGYVASSVGRGAWGQTWGETWGRAWFNIAAATPASPSPNNTARISGDVTENATKRIPD